MARKTPTYAPVNGRTYKIVKLDGKAPFKAILLNADGSESFRTHHKDQSLALAKCHTYNPNIPVFLA